MDNTSASHTPGPWVWGDEKDNSAGLRYPEGIEYLARTGAAVALGVYGAGEPLTGPVVLMIDAEDRAHYPSEPDARLIQSAPDLLAALEACAIFIEARAWKDREPWPQCLVDAHGVIVQAKGVAP